MGLPFGQRLLAECRKRAWIVADRLLRGPSAITMEVESLAEAKWHIAKLQDTVSALSARIELLEAENLLLRSSGDARSSSLMNGEGPLEGVRQLGTGCDAPDSAVSGGSRRKQRKKVDAGDMSHYQRRHVALKLMYVGSRFHGFASQPGSLRTVESDLFAALEHTKLLMGGRAEANYSRCGRTDRGVSASGQVIALKLRSNRKQGGQEETEGANSGGGTGDRVAAARASRDQEGDFAAGAEQGEIDYVGVLNRALPEDIRVLGWCPVPDSFSARFSCLHREYKYFFFDDALDVERMRQACQKFLGEHDFRNFCKMDAANIHNFVRYIMEIDILPAGREALLPGMGMWVLRLKGTAFLWHQVRCIASVLFMVGSGKEPVSIVDDLLDVHRTPRKPQYVMASELPLLLHTCAFQGLSFKCSSDAARQLHLHMRSLLTNALVSAELLREAVPELPLPAELAYKTMGGPKHIPLMLRPTEPTYEERQRKISRPCLVQLVSS